MPIMLDESLCGEVDAERAVASRLVRPVQPAAVEVRRVHPVAAAGAAREAARARLSARLSGRRDGDPVGRRAALRHQRRRPALPRRQLRPAPGGEALRRKTSRSAAAAGRRRWRRRPGRDDRPGPRRVGDERKEGSIGERRAFATFRASDGYTFYYRHYPAAGEPRRRLVFLHGIRSHGGWYTRRARRSPRPGFDVSTSSTAAGAGLNTARRGDTPSFRRLLDDVAEFIQSLRGRSRLPAGVRRRHLVGREARGRAAVPPAGVGRRARAALPGVGAKGGAAVARAASESRLPASVRPWQFFPIPLERTRTLHGVCGWQKFIDTDPHGLRLATARSCSAASRSTFT